MSLLALRDLRLDRGGRRLFSIPRFELVPGSVALVLGPNGAGKSSLLQALAGFLACGGDIVIGGERLAAMSRQELSKWVAWMGALPPAEFGLTVRQRLELASGGLNPPEQEMEAAARAMEVERLLDHPLGALSSGERQRVELAALMLRDVPLWLVDEPTAHLDLKHQAACLRMLRARRQACEGGRGMVVVLHDLAQARALARGRSDRVLLLDGRGGLRQGGAELLDDVDALSAAFDVPLTRSRDGIGPRFDEPEEGA